MSDDRKRSGDFNPGANAIQVMTMKVSKGLEFPVVALTGVGHMPAVGEDEKEAARDFYVAATRATQRLVMGTSGSGGFRVAFAQLESRNDRWCRMKEASRRQNAHFSLTALIDRSLCLI